MKFTKAQKLQEQVALAHAEKVALCAVLINLIVEHTKILGGDKEQALSRVEEGLRKTASSVKVAAKDVTGADVDISRAIQARVNHTLNQVFRDARKRVVPKSVH